MRFVDVTLAAPAGLLPELERLYDGMTGETTLRFRADEGDPFYHFALLVPGDRFEAALAWAEERFELLGGVFEFESWDARAVYFLDPAGNIVELIAHRGLEENGRKGEFGAEEIVGFSELGLVGNRAERLRTLGLPLWAGTIRRPRPPRVRRREGPDADPRRERPRLAADRQACGDPSRRVRLAS